MSAIFSTRELSGYKPYMGKLTPDAYRALYREKRQRERALKMHPCATEDCDEMIGEHATLCQSCAARAREKRLAESGAKTRRGQSNGRERKD